MRYPMGLVCLLLVLLSSFASAAPAGAKGTLYQTGFTRWRAADGGFTAWQRSGVSLAADGSLQLDPGAPTETDPYPAGGYNGGNFYNGGSYHVGEATSPEIATSFGFHEAIASWNASTPPGTWIETQIRAQLGSRWTKWFNLGICAADYSTIRRHSINLQGDSDGFVAVDTLVLTSKKVDASAFQLKVRLFSANGAIPSVRNISVAISTTPGKPDTLTPGDPNRWNHVLNVPECSQMVYPDGGEVWCSPTSTSMVLAYWENDTGPCEPRVRAAVDGVFDWIYDGHGNWPFNTAYAATQGLEGYVARFTSLAQAEEWIAAGVPVVISYAWKKSTLDGAPIPSSNGHLAVLVGFDAAGNPIVNDPAAPGNDSVQRTYDRAQLETQWLETSGGTVYLIYPPGWPAPTL
jgi:Peptidase_C39 like family